ncbi:MAG: hypothetical protein LBT25_05745, partial [Candidatus Symbiothrix sp.]|nr:hypothetical protein [Candidatus Symbiothrix sp.]
MKNLNLVCCCINNIFSKKMLVLVIGMVFLPFIFSSCLDSCRGHHIHYPLSEEIERYFHYFNEGNSWTYINQDSSKTDSLYLINIWEWNRGVQCDEQYERNMWLISAYFSSDSVFCKYYTHTFEFHENYSGPLDYTDFMVRGEYLTVIKYEDIPLHIVGTENTSIINDFILPNGDMYSDVVNYGDRFWLAPGVGIIQFLSYDEK